MNRLRAYVTEEAAYDARAAAEAAVPFEIGGILVGAVTRDGVWISDFVTILGRDRHHARFAIPSGTTHAAVDAARQIDDRLGYIGDWHTHPADIGPSGIDLATLRHLAAGPFGPRRRLGLLRRTGSMWVLDLWALDRMRAPVRVAYEMVGPLPRKCAS